MAKSLRLFNEVVISIHTDRFFHLRLNEFISATARLTQSNAHKLLFITNQNDLDETKREKKLENMINN